MSLVDLSDKQLAGMALKMWACYIETGEVNVSAQDAAKMGKPVRALTVDQMEIVVRLRRLSDRLYDEGTPKFIPGMR